MTRSLLLFTVCAAMLLLLAVILLWMGLDLGTEELARHRHKGY